MPGIFGFFDITLGSHKHWSTTSSAALNTMAEAMRYEPFYTSRLYENADLGVYVGWVGSAEALSYPVPISDHQNRLSLFLSGSLVGETANGNKSAHGSIDRRSEGNLTLNKYMRFGENFPEKINGLVSGMLIDERHEVCLLFNDRFGMERLFLYQDDEKLVFSSEAKAILAIISETRGFDPEGLGQFLACGCTLGEKSLFRKIRILPGGSVIKLAKGRPPQFSKYFDRSALENLEPLGEKEFLERFSCTLKVGVNEYLKPPSSAAVSLTGGLDSRMIMSCLNAADGTVPCYTFGSMYRETYDVLVAREVAKKCRQPHKTLVLGEDFLDKFKDYLEKAVFISDGYLGLSGAAELYLNILARSIAPLRITGNYGGELLRGVRAFKSSIPKGEFIRSEMLAQVIAAEQTFARTLKVRPTSFTLFNQVSSGYGRYAIERSQVGVMSPFLDKKLVELIYRRPAKLGAKDDPSIAVIQKCNPELVAIPTDRGLLGNNIWPIRKTRRVHREALFKLEYWTGHGMPNIIARASSGGLCYGLENLFTGRHKFQHFRKWLKHELANCAKEVLLGNSLSNVSEYIDFSRIKKMLHDHLDGKRNFTEEIDKVMTIVLADRLLLKN